MDELLMATTVIHIVNALLWTVVVVGIFRKPLPVAPLTRQVVASVLLFGMWVFAFGWLAALGIVGVEVVRSASTIFTAYGAIAATALLTVRD